MKSANQLDWWWQALMAVPECPDSLEYERLKRVWFDHTWKDHPFLNPSHENHLTATLFENLVLFPASKWLPMLVASAALHTNLAAVNECRWAYEVLDRRSGKLADIAIHARSGGEDFVFVVEAKAKNGPLKPSDRDPGSYLELDEFSWCENRFLIYLVDDADRSRVSSMINDSMKRSGILSWQDLGGLQVSLALEIDCPIQIRSFLAGAVQHQFCSRGFIPTNLSAPYLRNEPKREHVNSVSAGKMTDYYTNWRLNS